MKKLVSISICILLGHAAYGQLIKGTVFDAEDQSAIPYASVYFSGTMVGTASDEDGQFEIDITKYKTKPLIIRAIGYEAYTLKLIPDGEPYKILLTPSRYEIEEVAVSTKSLARKRQTYLRLFRSEFLGNTGNQRNCQILNEEDISFMYAAHKDSVIAFATEPIVIFNGSLGYLITYYLDDFSYDKKRDVVTFKGDIVFKEDLGIKDVEMRPTYHRKRKLTYLGSCMHFFRALWADQLEPNEFSVTRSLYEKASDTYSSAYTVDEDIRYKDMVILDNRSNKYLMSSVNLAVEYHSQSSRITLLKSKVLFEQNGFFDPSAIRWDGHMAMQRVADLLPYEYFLEE